MRMQAKKNREANSLPCANRTNPVTVIIAMAIIFALVKIICILVDHFTLAQLMAVMTTVCVRNLHDVIQGIRTRDFAIHQILTDILHGY